MGQEVGQRGGWVWLHVSDGRRDELGGADDVDRAGKPEKGKFFNDARETEGQVSSPG